MLFDRLKPKFDSSFNSIYSKLGKINNPIVTLHSISSIALPSLLFAVGSLSLTKTVLNSLEHPWSRDLFMKVFRTYDAMTVKCCQHYTDFLPIGHMARLLKVKLITSLKNDFNSCLM